MAATMHNRYLGTQVYILLQQLAISNEILVIPYHHFGFVRFRKHCSISHDSPLILGVVEHLRPISNMVLLIIRRVD